MLSTMVLALGLMAAAALAQTFKAWNCTGNSDVPWDEQIVGCTNAIKAFAGRDLAAALNNRGIAYQAKDALDRAIGDYNAAIQHDPKSAAAFNNRGISYQGKGEFDRAIGDYNEAIRLDPKYAAAFNNRASAYRAKGELDRAIEDYNEAIRLDRKYAVAFNNRANAYRTKGELDRAIEDYNEAVRLDRKYAGAFNNRGNAYRASGEFDRAIRDYDEAIRLAPKDSGTYLNRGLANLYAGSLPKALADLNQSTALDPKFAHTALWREIVDRRSNLPSRLAQAMTQIDMSKWPAPIIRLYLGEMAPEAVLSAAENQNADTKRDQLCEANFYIGELALQRGTKEEAVRLFELAAAECRKSANVWADAKAELKALGAQP
jgi:tetratricopeptide (TPR) repeat protein